MNELTVDVQLNRPVALSVRIDCKPGELLAVVGPSGAGKTSLLKVLAGLMNPQMGQISVGEAVWVDCQHKIFRKPSERRVGMVFQDYALMPHLDAADNVALALDHLPKATRRAEALVWLNKVRLTAGQAHRRPQALSGGQQQRVALARALARQPALLLLDEPFSAVDQMNRQSLYGLLAELRQQLNIPIVLVTHDLNEARLLCDRLVVLDEGQVLQSGPPREVYRRPRNMRVADLLGIQNRFQGVWLGESDEPGWGRLGWMGQHGESIDLLASDKGKIPAGFEVSWVIHGDGIRLYTGGDLPAHHRLFEASLSRHRDLGELSMLELSIHQAPSLIVRLALSGPERLRLQAGQSVQLVMDLSYIHIMPKKQH